MDINLVLFSYDHLPTWIIQSHLALAVAVKILLVVDLYVCMFEYLQKLCIMENERYLLEYEKKDLEKKLADQKTESELLRAQLKVCGNYYC